MKKLLLPLIVFCFCFNVFAAETVERTNPYTMVHTVAELTFKRFAQEQADIKKNPNLLKNIVREELIPYVDYRYSAFKVIGHKNFKDTTKEQRKAFSQVFLEYLVTSYAQVFTLYNNQKVEFEPSQSIEGKKIVSVNTKIIENGRDPINISFRVRFIKKTNEWKAYDMVAEGVSLLDSKQAELTGLIRQKGIEHVTAMLKEKSDRDITYK